MQMFYKVIYSERAFSPEAAKILTEETQKMINATKQVFVVLHNKRLLQFDNLEISAMSFALTIHALMDYSLDESFSKGENVAVNFDLIKRYISNFCLEHNKGENL